MSRSLGGADIVSRDTKVRPARVEVTRCLVDDMRGERQARSAWLWEYSPQICEVRTGSQEGWVSLLAAVDMYRGRHGGLEQAQENCGQELDLEPPMNPIRQPRTLFVYNWAVFSTSVQVEKDVCDKGEADIG